MVSDTHKGRTRVELNPKEVETLLYLVMVQIKEKPFQDVILSSLPAVFNKLQRASKRIKP